MRRGLPINVLLAVISILVAVGAIELGTRAVGPTIGFFLRPTPANCLRRSDLVSLEFRPDCDGELAGTLFRTNALGLRGPPLRDGGAPKILAVGDSCTWGWHVAQEEPYPMALQRQLDERLPSPRFDVLNAGVPGYTSYQGLLYLRERGLALRPAVVIIAFGFNDQFEHGDVVRQLEMEQRLMPVLRIDDFLLEQSVAYRWMRYQVALRASRKLPPRATPDRYGANLREMVRLARAANAQVLLLSFWKPFGKRQDYRQVLHDLAEELRVPIVEYSGPKLDLLHPTREGYEALGRLLFERLQEEGYVP